MIAFVELLHQNITQAFWFLLTQAMLKCKEQHHQQWHGSKLMLNELWYTHSQLNYDQPCALTHYISSVFKSQSVREAY